MNEFDFLSKTTNLATNPYNLPIPPTKYQLRTKTTDQMVKILMSSEMLKPANAQLRQMVIKLLQERKGNAFEQTLLGGKTAGGK